MILATIYFLGFLWIVYKLPFFKDSYLSFKLLSVILILKLIGCLVYYWIYFKYYPGNFQSDSSSTMQDASVIYNALPNHIGDFFKIIFGFHSELESDSLYQNYFKNIDKWGRDDASSAFFLNDNRTPIRINAVIMIFSLGNYAVHAIVMLMLSFIGQFAFYKTFKSFFVHKEFGLAAIIFLSPSILFWTSGVLKEPLIWFIFGMFFYHYFKLFIQKQFSIQSIILLLSAIALFFVLKPYVLVLILIPLIIYTLVKKYQIKQVFLSFFIGVISAYTLGILTLKIVFNKDVVQALVTRQNDFINLSKGGFFFLNDENYLRLDYADAAQFDIVDSSKNLCKIKPHAKLMYWNLRHMRDTVYVTDNQDTSLYVLHSQCAPAGSAIEIEQLQYSVKSFAKLVPLSFYNVLCKPFFWDARSVMELIASFENLLFLIVFVFCFYFRIQQPIDKNTLWFCVSIIVTSFILIGLSTTVVGAIVRYKVPFIPFLLMVPLLFLDTHQIKKLPIVSRFIKSD